MTTDKLTTAGAIAAGVTVAAADELPLQLAEVLDKLGNGAIAGALVVLVVVVLRIERRLIGHVETDAAFHARTEERLTQLERKAA